MTERIEEFKKLQFKRDEEYFKDGYASWEVMWKKRKWHINAVYSNDALIKNELTKDYSNGIRSFDILDDKYNFITNIKIGCKHNIVSLEVVENYIMRRF